MCVHCTIVPNDILIQFSKDQSLPDDVRQGFADSASIDTVVRKVRSQARSLTRSSQAVAASFAAVAAVAAAPVVRIYDCKNTTTFPGSPIANPGTSADATIKGAYATTTKVAEFYDVVFNRNSIDDAGMTIVSSVHFGSKYNNAFWNGFQMMYGDGDGLIFLDFTKGDDVVCHELTHGVTQHSLQLVYANEPGGLNESLSDVFGSMFRQWMAGQTATTADWLIGSDILGPSAKAKGLTCLRDMASPGAGHCLAPQKFRYKDYTPGMDPHYSSGIPNLAFCEAAKGIGGKSWEKAGQIWYKADRLRSFAQHVDAEVCRSDPRRGGPALSRRCPRRRGGRSGVEAGRPLESQQERTISPCRT